MRIQELLDTLVNIYGTKIPSDWPASQNVPETDCAADEEDQTYEIKVSPDRSLPQEAFEAASATDWTAPPSLHILLTEDNKINQKFATALLQKAGHTVELAENGHQAVAAVCRADFDVVLMDIQMPELDGVSATQQIRALPEPKNRIPIIAMTAHAMAGNKEEYLAAGMNDYVSKPVQPTVILGKLARIEKRTASAGPAITVRFEEEPRVTAQANTPPFLDFNKLSELDAVMPPTQYRDFVNLYLADIELHLQQIALLRAQGEHNGIAHFAHDIVSTSGNIGAMRVSAAARSLEEACQAGFVDQTDALVQDLKLACRQSAIALRTWLELRRADDQPAIAV